MVNINFNATQSENSFLRHIKLSFFNREKIAAKATVVALVILTNSVPLASAIYGCKHMCANQCKSMGDDCFTICAQDCIWKPA
ncbi:MAG: hypothetical protein ACRDDW_00405 [Candidatus Rhabdochlamydia sp.]